MCLFTLLPIYGVNPPSKKAQFWGVNRRFQAQLAKTKNVHITKTTALIDDCNQILHSDKDHQMSFVGSPHTRITNPRWRTAAILEKSKKIYLSRGSSDFDEISHDDAIRPS